MARSSRDVAVEIVKVLQQAGQVAYLAGGCVRDELLGLHPKDYDVATDAHPERVRQLFKRSWYVGESFGVVRVHVEGSDQAVEVATFRSEWEYQDGRRPSQIQYTDAQHDAHRRDFTINALFEDPFRTDEKARVIDFVDGQADLRQNLVRAVGDPESRLAEDYLRLLRAVRFASRLDFEIESATGEAIKRHARDLGKISRERIGQEIMWMLTPGAAPGDDNTTSGVDRRSAQAIQMIQAFGLDGATLNEPHADPPLETVQRLVELGQTSQPSRSDSDVVSGSSPTDKTLSIGYGTILAAWLLDRHGFSGPGAMEELSSVQGASSPPDAGSIQPIEQFVVDRAGLIIQRWRSALCLSNEHRDRLQSVLHLLPEALSWCHLTVARRKRLLAQPLWLQVYMIVVAVLNRRPASSAEWVTVVQQDRANLIVDGLAPVPFINGEDLIVLGRKPGPDFRRLLDAVYDAQLEGLVTSHDEAIRWLQQQQ